MNYKYVYSFLLIIIFVFITQRSSFASSDVFCSYQSKIDRCMLANNQGITRSIEDFICIVGSNEEIKYQIVLDDKFSIVDKKMDDFLFNLEKDKNLYFGINKTKNYIDAINDINLKSNNFKNELLGLCNGDISREVASCSYNNSVSNNNAKKFFKDSDCKNLAEKKIGIFNDLSFNILILNKQQIRADEKKLYDQKQRSNYNRLLDIMMINLGYMERIWKKWPSKLLNTK